MPRATSRTSTTFSPVSMNAGMPPLRKSATILPVGGGLHVMIPTGAVGFTITTGNPPRANSSATCSARNFERL